MAKSKGKILIVEDDEAQSLMYETEFQKEGYEVLTSRGEEDTFEMVALKPDLILLDLLLGNSSGETILEKLKSDPETKDIKVAIISNFQKNGLKEKCFKLGAVDFIIKSNVVPKELVERAGKIID